MSVPCINSLWSVPLGEYSPVITSLIMSLWRDKLEKVITVFVFVFAFFLLVLGIVQWGIVHCSWHFVHEDLQIRYNVV